ncbi:hypothetical protein M899_0778 [Bacteriovorax sp. BSW11_IV]|uniref:hypothetical protein n=1 Tax=Bacteriovorax sp. BSW11_IV TaxID=1353529 RepID=UPI00038A27BE|nr:hypothetical protein [Bacteriovorax sp. BSW11_IV]EQC49195.1 hypothetical protein M899_0778 [Bacteriovorax sp. BSW11_IV]
MKIVKSLTLTSLFLLSACSSTGIHKTSDRTPSSVKSEKPYIGGCFDTVGRFLEDDYANKLAKALEEKKLVQRKTKRLTIKAPGKHMFARMLDYGSHIFKKIINDNRYHAFYMYDDEETLPNILIYIKGLVGDEKAMGGFEDSSKIVTTWLKEFKNYEADLDEMLKMRVSLAYNLNILKTYKKSNPDFDRIQFSLWKNGKWEETIITIRQDDHNLEALIGDLQSKLNTFDGGWRSSPNKDSGGLARISIGHIDEGMLRTRVLKQAYLRDRLTILHRELEFAYNNLNNRDEFASISEENKKVITDLYKELSFTLAKEEYRPSHWAENRISYKKFMSEFKYSSKSSKYYQKFLDKSEKIKNYLSTKDLSRARFTSEGYRKYARAGYFTTTAGLSVGGVVTIFNLDDKLAEMWEEALKWWYGDKIECVKADVKNDSAYFDCLWKYYKQEYPDLVTLATKNRNFNPFDPEDPIMKKIPEPVRSAYIEDYLGIKKLRDAYKIIAAREKEIKELFILSQRKIGDATQTDLDDLQECVIVATNRLPFCIFNNVLNPLMKEGPYHTELVDKQDPENFEFNNYEGIPQPIREQYRQKVEQIMDERALLSDLKDLDDKSIRFLFD